MILLIKKDLDIQNIGGLTKSNIKIFIPLKSQEKLKETKISADAKIINLSTSIFNVIEIKQGVFQLSLEDDLMTLKGDSNINNQKCELELLSYLKR